jgi:hypothetical protein
MSKTVFREVSPKRRSPRVKMSAKSERFGAAGTFEAMIAKLTGASQELRKTRKGR